jgi:hypothetical protein
MICVISIRFVQKRSQTKNSPKGEGLMKKINKGQLARKLELNKQTIDDLTKDDLQEIRAGKAKYEPCWENLWTLYHCNVMYTGDPEYVEKEKKEKLK